MREARASARAWTRLSTMAVFTLVLFVIYLIPTPLGKISHRFLQPWRSFIGKLWGRGMARILGMRIHRVGPVPKRPYYMVANHLSWVDIPVVASQTGSMFVAMAEMESWPMWGHIAEALGTIFIDRKNYRETVRVNKLIAEALDAGEGVTVFAESTTSHGESVLPFKPALFETAAQRNMPVHFATIYFDTPKGVESPTENVHWVEDITFWEHLMNLLRIPQFSAIIIFGEQPVQGGGRKELAQKAETAVEGQLPRWR